MDYILENGNETFKIIGIPHSLAMNELPLNIMIENCNIAVEFLGNQFGLLGNNNLFEGHASCDTGNGLIFTTGGFSFSIIWSKNSVFLFDSHSRDENGGFVSNGCSVILSFRYLNDVQYYIHAVYSKQLPNFPEIQYEIQYIRVATDVNLSAILDSINKSRRRLQNKIYFHKICGTARHDEVKTRKCEKRAELLGTPEHEQIKQQKREKHAATFGTPEHDKIKKTEM